MATRIDHSNCGHPRTPAARAACRAGRPQPTHRAPLTAEELGIKIPTKAELTEGMTVKEKARFARQLTNDAARAKGRMEKRGKAPVITDASQLPMPKLTPAQLDSPIFRSLLRNRA